MKKEEVEEEKSKEEREKGRDAMDWGMILYILSTCRWALDA